MKIRRISYTKGFHEPPDFGTWIVDVCKEVAQAAAEEGWLDRARWTFQVNWKEYPYFRTVMAYTATEEGGYRDLTEGRFWA